MVEILGFVQLGAEEVEGRPPGSPQFLSVSGGAALSSALLVGPFQLRILYNYDSKPFSHKTLCLSETDSVNLLLYVTNWCSILPVRLFSYSAFLWH